MGRRNVLTCATLLSTLHAAAQAAPLSLCARGSPTSHLALQIPPAITDLAYGSNAVRAAAFLPETGGLYAFLEVGCDPSGDDGCCALMAAPAWGRGNTTSAVVSVVTDLYSLPAGMVSVDDVEAGTPLPAVKLCSNGVYGDARRMVRDVVAVSGGLGLVLVHQDALLTIDAAALAADGGSALAPVADVYRDSSILFMSGLWVDARDELCVTGVRAPFYSPAPVSILCFRRNASSNVARWLAPVEVVTLPSAYGAWSSMLAVVNFTRAGAPASPGLLLAVTRVKSILALALLPNGSWINTPFLLAGGGPDAINPPADGTPAAGASLNSMGHIFPWTLGGGGGTSALVLADLGRVVWPDGTLGSVDTQMFGSGNSVKSSPVRLPFPQGGGRSSIDALLVASLTYVRTSDQDKSLRIAACPLADGASTCPAGQPCAVLSAGEESPVSCPRGVLCSAGTLTLFGPNDPCRVLVGYQDCPPGEMCADFNMSVGVPCPAGSMCRRIDNATALPQYAVLPCAGGHWCPPRTQLEAESPCFGSVAAPCPACPNGTRPAGNAPCGCPPGVLCPGGSAEPTGLPTGNFCPAGFFCTAKSEILSGACAPGYSCPEASYTVLGANVFGKLGGRCPAGSYCPGGSAAPIDCPAGTFSNTTGRFLPCEQCPQGRWSAATAQSSNTTCRACPAGTTTTAAGAASRDACLALPFSCPLGSQPKKARAASAADCVPLTCARGLALAQSGASCQGCGAGSVGRLGACAACNTSREVCPGLLSFALPSPADLQAALSALLESRGASAPPVLALPVAGGGGARALSVGGPSCDALYRASLPYVPAPPAAPSTWVSSYKGEVTIGAVAGALGIAVLVAGLLAMTTHPEAAAAAVVAPEQAAGKSASAGAAAPPGSSAQQAPPASPPTRAAARHGCRHRAGACLRRWLMEADQFSLVHKVEPFRSPLEVETPLGGTCTILGALAILAIWAVLILQRAQNNVQRTITVDAAFDDQQVQAVAATQQASSSGVTGLHVIVTAAGEPGECANLVSWRSGGLFAGTFTHSVTSCGVAAQHVFSCPDCVVTAGSTLEAVLPWSCQALLMQAVAVSELGEMSIRSAAAAAPAPAPDADPTVVTLLAAVDADVPPMLLLQNDTTKDGSPTTRGYRLLPGSIALATRDVQVDDFTPAIASVRLAVNLSPSGIYQNIQLSERITLVQLLSQLVGMVGLLGAFGFAVEHLERPLLRFFPHAGFNAKKHAPAAATAQQAAVGVADATGGSGADMAKRPAPSTGAGSGLGPSQSPAAADADPTSKALRRPSSHLEVTVSTGGTPRSSSDNNAAAAASADGRASSVAASAAATPSAVPPAARLV